MRTIITLVLMICLCNVVWGQCDCTDGININAANGIDGDIQGDVLKVWRTRDTSNGRPADWTSILHVGINSNSDFQIGSSYTGSNAFWLRGRYDVNGSWNPWHRIITNKYAKFDTNGSFSGSIECNNNLKISDVSATHIELALTGWGAQHGLLFNAYKDGDGYLTNVAKYANDAGSYTNGAGAIIFTGNGGAMDFYVSPTSTGKDNIINWGSSRLRINKYGNIGIGTTAPQSRLHIVGGNLDIGDTGSENYLQFRRSSDGAPRGLIGLHNDQDFRIANHGGYGYLTFYTNSGSEMSERVRITPSGNLGIGTTTPSAKLDVAGNIKAHEIEVTLAAMQDLQLNGTLAANNITYTANGNTADFVFEDNYQLKDLSEVEAFIKANKHLPEMPSADEMEESGVNLAEMNKLLLMKVEELTLYSIEQEKKIEARDEKVESLELKVEELKEEGRRVVELEERLVKLEALLSK